LIFSAKSIWLFPNPSVVIIAPSTFKDLAIAPSLLATNIFSSFKNKIAGVKVEEADRKWSQEVIDNNQKLVK